MVCRCDRWKEACGDIDRRQTLTNGTISDVWGIFEEGESKLGEEETGGGKPPFDIFFRLANRAPTSLS